MLLSHLISRQRQTELDDLQNTALFQTVQGEKLRFQTEHLPRALKHLIKQGYSAEEVEKLARKVSENSSLEEHLYLLLQQKDFPVTLESLHNATAFYEKYPTWWQQTVEARFETLAENHRKQLDNQWDLTEFDIGVGITKGVYQFGKGIIVGVADLLKMAYALSSSGETRTKAFELLKDWSYFCFKLYFGNPQQREEAARSTKEFTQKLVTEISESVQMQWEKASAEGKEAELISRWTTLGVLEIATAVLALTKATKTTQTLANVAATAPKSSLETSTLKAVVHTIERKPARHLTQTSAKQLWKNKKANRSPAARKRAMQLWYKTYFKRDGQRQRHTILKKHLKGINFSKPIYIKKFKKGEIVEQWVLEGREPGKYFSYLNSSMDGLAITGNRKVVRFRVIRDFEGVEATVASYPQGLIVGVGGTGGEQQLVIPLDWKDYLQKIE